AQLAQLPQENFSNGYCSEVNLWLQPWLASIADRLVHGLVLLIDYGYPAAEYYHPDRVTGTLRCHYRHRAHDDPFFFPGIQDITAHVDFTALANAAVDVGFTVSGYCHQAAFLLSCGFDQMAVELSARNTLLMPYAMGEVFKVMALTKDYPEPLLGFALLDQRGKL
ncbi:MAG: SAM-dependent methyltransferase, partial [Gammaproteobacteria bacterium]|nr:SAM-dependent methyltransferase [Gammaproteobacteria bacterium]